MRIAINSLLVWLLLLCLACHPTFAQQTTNPTGNYSVTESWSVTVWLGNGETVTRRTYSGTERGTLAITNGNYLQINDTGVTDLGRLSLARTIYDSGFGYYEVDGDIPPSGEVKEGGECYYAIRLTFFLIKVPVPCNGGFTLASDESSAFDTTGASLASLSGSGTNYDAFGEDTTNGFLNEIDESSTSSLTPAPPPGAVAPSITTQPRSQSAALGTNLTLTVNAAGTEPLSFQWMHEGTNLVDAGEFSGSATAVLTIDGVQAPDAGAYSVVVSNVKGSVRSAVATLTVGALFALEINGQGTVTPNDNGQVLPTGHSYKLTAKPDPGYSFAGWTGSIVAGTPVLAFTMETNMSLVANFVPNPFIPQQGTFNGLFMDSNDSTEGSSGFFTLALTTSGAFTGKIMTSGSTYSLPTATPFGLGGQAEFTVPTKQSALTFNLQLDVSDPASQQITGTVSDGAWTAGLTADRAVFSATTNKAVNYEGLYTLAIAGSEDATASPGGLGCATLSISPAGLITMAGNLADGTPMSQSVSVSKDGRWPFYAAYPAAPAGNGGAVLGWLIFSNQPATALGGTLSWFRPAGNAPAVYQSGFTNLAVPVIGSAYNPADNPLLALSTGQVTLDGGSLPFAITNQATLSSSGTITVSPPNTDKLALTINKTTGAISGSFANPSNPKQSIKVNGVLLQNQTNAVGYFLGTSQSGAFLLENP